MPTKEEDLENRKKRVKRSQPQTTSTTSAVPHDPEALKQEIAALEHRLWILKGQQARSQYEELSPLFTEIEAFLASYKVGFVYSVSVILTLINKIDGFHQRIANIVGPDNVKRLFEDYPDLFSDQFLSLLDEYKNLTKSLISSGIKSPVVSEMRNGVKQSLEQQSTKMQRAALIFRDMVAAAREVITEQELTIVSPPQGTLKIK